MNLIAMKNRNADVTRNSGRNGNRRRNEDGARAVDRKHELLNSRAEHFYQRPGQYNLKIGRFQIRNALAVTHQAKQRPQRL